MRAFCVKGQSSARATFLSRPPSTFWLNICLETCQEKLRMHGNIKLIMKQFLSKGANYFHDEIPRGVRRPLRVYDYVIQ